ncbi:MAG: hypothetical protein AAF787_16625, partial [Chloroflexota bacterium]
MSNDDRNKKSQRSNTVEDQFKDFALEVGKLTARFVYDVSRLSVKGVFLAYRAIAARRSKEARSGDLAVRNVDSVIDDIGWLKRLRNRGEGQSTGETTADTPAATQQSVPVTPPSQRVYVDDDPDSDPEAASMLEDLLQQTANQMQQIAPTKQTDKLPTREMPAVVIDEPTENAEAEEMKYAPPTVPEDVVADIPAPVEAPATEEPEQKEITYNTPDEQARIAEQLAQRQKLLEQEQELRPQIADEDERRREELRKAV